ncbi:LuxR C-terminal-related transcriptional regulator [Rhodococcus sp. OK519]|uniref:LuxR C-terminal-related transcriptional regulator n=1 Tax=Rhodococcus sp. OK519 TaxID=2135729 RepID=UPI002158CDC3
MTVQPRADLYSLLDSVVAREVPGRVLICAAAGTGKTVLLVDWLERTARDRTVMWVTLGPDDNDVRRLESTLDNVRLGVQTARRPVIVVFDDAHALSDDAALGMLAAFMESAPAHSTVILACRRSPQLPLTRYAIEGSLTWIGWEELALDLRSVAAIVAEHGGVLGAADLDTLHDLTQGWAVPVRIAAIRLALYGDPGAAIADLVRHPQPISEYVVAETLGALPGYLVRFIEATSIVDSFDPDLAEQLDEANVDRALADRERLGVPIRRFVSGAKELQYSWHPLLRSHVRAALRGRDPNLSTRLQMIAARWFQDSGRPVAALEQMVAAADEDAIEEFVFRHGVTAVFDRRAEEMFGLLGTRYGDLPGVPQLRALAALELNYPDAARAHLRAAASKSTAQRFRVVADAFTTALEVECVILGGGAVADGMSARLEACPATGNVDLDCYVLLQDALARMFRGDLAQSERILRQALTLADVGAHPRQVLRSLARLAVLSGIQGEFETMRVRAARALDYAVEHGVSDRIDAFQCAAAILMDAHMRFEVLPENSPVHALVSALRRHFRPDGTTAPVSGTHASVAFALLRTRRTARPTPDDADAAGRALIKLFRGGPQSGLSNIYITIVVAVLLNAGRTNTAAEVIDHAVRVFGDSPDVMVARAMTALSGGDTATAREFVGTVLSSHLSPTLGVRAWLVDAVVAYRERRSADASASLARALERAEPNRTVSPFVDHAADVADMFASLPSEGQYTHAFVVHVGAKLAEANAGRNPGLTRTERLILTQLSTGKPLRAIAGDLHVSLNTVRTHTRNVYRKLEASSRAEALGNARRRGLLVARDHP